MREIQQDVLLEERLETIEKLSSVKKPAWITEEARKIHEAYKALRESILTNRTKWNYFDYCHRFSNHFYNIALLYYTYFQKHNINLDIIRISLDKCLSKLNGIRLKDREIKKTQELYTKVTAFKKAIDKIYIDLENKLNNVESNNEERINKAKILINLGHVDYENFDFNALELSSFRTHVLSVHLINFMSVVEEILTLHVDKDHYNKSNICRYVARVYKICGQQNIHDDYMKKASKQITLAFQQLGEEDTSPELRKKVRKIIKHQVLEFGTELIEIYKIIKQDYNIELSNLDCLYVEQKFIKYCAQGLSDEINKVLAKISSRSNNEKVFMMLLSNIEKVKTLHDFQDCFTTGVYYKLLISHEKILKLEKRKLIISNFKRDVWNVVSPKITEAQQELDVLKQLIIFLRSVTDTRSIITMLQLSDFCNKIISIQSFINNILKLELDNEELNYLKTLTLNIKHKKTLFFMDKFIEVLQSYAFPPYPIIEGYALILKGKLVILSEVMKNVLNVKTAAIKELRIASDIVVIDENLENEQWSGINIVVIATTIHVQGSPIWNVSGREADNYQSRAEDGSNPGDDGKNGKNGLSGQSGGNVYISCTNILNSPNFTIISNGGKGGIGQDGGNGAKGEDGIGIKLSEFENLINPVEPSYEFTKIIFSVLQKTVEIAINPLNLLTDRFNLEEESEKNQLKSNIPNVSLPNPAETSYDFTKKVFSVLQKTVGIAMNPLNLLTDRFNLEEEIEKLRLKSNIPDVPLPKISCKVKTYDITWSKAQFRLNFWNTGPCFFTGDTEDLCKITYSYYPHWMPSKQEVLVLCEGTVAHIGGQGGKGGLEGPEGFSGEIIIKCKHPSEIIIQKNPGERGKKGQRGQTGYPGKNGWDVGFVFVNGWFSATEKIIGRNLDQKLSMKYHYDRKDSDFVYCPYRHKSLGVSDNYIEITGRSSNTNVYERNNNRNQNEEEQETVTATRSKAISRNVISELEADVSIDVVDELADLALNLEGLKEQALEEIIEKDQEKETEMTTFQVQRQAVFDDSALQKERKILRKRQKYIKTEHINLNVTKICENPIDKNVWFNLKYEIVNLPDLNKLFNLLFIYKAQLKTNFSQIHNILLNKYKIAICQEIEKNKKIVDLEVYFNPEPVENYLVVDTNPREFTHDELGILQEYFVQNHENHLPKLQKYLKHVDVGLILYPLKFFIMEKSYNDQTFKHNSHLVLEKLNNLESRLERLIKCYILAYQTDEHSSMLLAIERRKNEIIKAFKDETDYEFIRKEFMKYIKDIGMSSTAVRELLSVAFDVNIKIFLLNQDNDLILYHNHNPTSKNIVHLFLSNSQFVEFRIDDQHVNLIAERKKISKNYTDILGYTNNFVCKRDFDEFYLNFDQFNGYESSDTDYLSYRKLSEENIIQKICAYFSETDKNTIMPVINKLKSGIIQNHNLLKALLKRFDTEGMHVSTYEMLLVVTTILRAYLDKNANLEIFEWILSVKEQTLWLNEIYYMELENYFKKSLKNTNIPLYLSKVKQKDIIVLMDSKLRKATDNISMKCISTCLEVLSEIEVDEDTIRSLPLSKWQYTLREQLLEYRLCCITQWKSNDQLQKALFYLNCLESNIGSTLINKFLRILDRQKKDITTQICLDIFAFLHLQEWSLDYELLEKIDKYGIHSIIHDLKKTQLNLEKERSIETLLKLIENNSHTSSKTKNVLQTFKQHPFLVNNIEKSFSEANIKEWSKTFKSNIRGLEKTDKKKYINDQTNEMLFMILHAIKLKKKFLLRKTQRLAILLMLSNNYNTLSQISTGEGKSLIVVAVSIFKSLCEEKVDVITSSSVLAVRDATNHKDIYDIFDVCVSHNCSEKIDERRDAYSSCPVIFGDLSNFQRDCLLDRFYGMNIIGDRTFDTLIVDEVDSMLLDKGNNTLYLSHEIPGLDKLESVYQFLWKRICMSAGKKVENFEDALKQEVFFDLFGTLTIEDLEYNLHISKLEATAIYNLLKDMNVIDQKHRVLKNICDENAVELTNLKPHYHKVRYLINKILKRHTEIRIPKCLYQFVERHIDIWIKNGVLAIAMEEGIDYVVDVDRTQTKADINPNITIIDKGTGTDQSNSQWEEALHQFLQLKHGCKLSSQNLKAVFISNVSYFKKYSKLFGLTGTLGSQVERDLLEELYDVQFVNVPTAKPKKFIEQEPIICCTETDWQYRIVNRSKELIEADRSVLIICETIKEVNTLSKAFEQANISNNKIYKREYEECLLAQGKEQLDGGSIIIATNLAGRGTDIKITENLNKNGGLHVLLTYLPCNARIEQQAFGRSARSGCNGSGQLIIIGYGSFLDKREQREAQERQRIADIKVIFDTRIKVEESFFESFTEVYKKCKNSYFSTTDKKLKEIGLQRLLDRWAFWIDEYGSKLSDNSIDKIFNDFKNDLKKKFTQWEKWVNDPIQLIKVGLNYINKKSYNKAIKVFDIVIQLEPLFCEAAHYYKATALVLLLNFEKRPFTEKSKEYFDEFVIELRKAERLFDAHKNECMVSSAFIQNLKQNMKNSFMTIDAYRTQQETLINLYDFYVRSINDILGHPITKSSFISQEIKENVSEDIYNTFIENSILKKSHIVKANFEDIEELSINYGISSDELSKFLKSNENECITEQCFLNNLKQKIKIPNLEECWNTLVNEQKLTNEIKFAIIQKSKLTTSQEKKLKSIKQLEMNMKSKGKYVFMKQYINTDEEDPFIFKEKTLKRYLPSGLYHALEKENIIIFNRIAEFSDKNLNEPISLYDSVNINNLTSDDIYYDEAQSILNILVEKKFLKRNTNSYTLVKDFDETKIPNIPTYNQSLSQILKINFAYRIALQNIRTELKTEDQVFIRVTSEPHVNLMWELIEKKILQPVTVQNHKSSSIDDSLKNFGQNEKETTSIKNYVREVLKKLAGSLKSLDTPSFELVDIIDNMEELQVSPLQELNTFRTNSLDFILKSKEKKYTWKMIWSTIIVTVIGLLEVAAGLLIQLFFAGTLSHVGNWLISEGISDLQYAVSCWSSGYFDWGDYVRHKQQSMIQSFFVICVTAGFSAGVRYSRFGNKLAMSGIKVAEKEVAEMTGRQLWNQVGGKAVAKEFGKQFIIKVGEGITKGLIQEGINHIVDSYLQNLCNQLASTLVQDIESAVNRHRIGQTLNESYRVLGAKQAKVRIVYHTEKSLSEPTMNNTLLAQTMKLTAHISTVCSEAAKRGRTLPYSQYVEHLSKILNVSQYVSHLADIITSVSRMLDKVDEELKKEIKEAKNEGIKQKTYADQEVNDFNNEVINKWRNMLKENGNKILSEKIAKPVLQDCASKLVSYGKEGVKKLYNFTINSQHRKGFQKIKQKKEKALQDQSLSDEARQQIIESYHESLAELKVKVRDPNLYAEIVMERGHMDAVCLKASSCVIDRLRGDDPRPVKLKVTTDSGNLVEYCTSGEGPAREICLKLENKHFTNADGNVAPNTADYECLYHSLVHEFPELSEMSIHDFRGQISTEIKTNNEIKNDIKHGKHAFTIRKNIYGGYRDEKISTQKLKRSLMNNEYMFSQNSCSEMTSGRGGLHLSELADNFRADPENRIYVVELENGKYVFLDHRRVVAASTIDNPEVNILVRIFNFDDKIEGGYFDGIKGDAAVKFRIQFTKKHKNREHPFSVKEHEIRESKMENIKISIQKREEFFKKTSEIGFIRKRRSSTSDLISDRRRG